MLEDPLPALLTLAAALALDQLAGEYPAPLHPVVWFGKAVSALLRLAPDRGWWRQLAFGAFLALGACAASVGVALLALRLTAGMPLAQILVGAFLLKASFALRELLRA